MPVVGTLHYAVAQHAICCDRRKLTPGWRASSSAPRNELITGGERGIRTLDTGFGPYAPLAGECLRPLGHLSGRARNCTRRAPQPSNGLHCEIRKLVLR